MKRFILLLTILTAVSISAFAVTDCPDEPQKDEWLKKVQAEKIAYLTSEMGLTPAEAQKFWPLYNQAQDEAIKARELCMRAWGDLEKAVRGNKSSKEISELITRYVKAEQESNSIDAKYAPQYMKIISPEKVAKLYIGEEGFRRLQMRNFSRGHQGKSSPSVPNDGK